MKYKLLILLTFITLLIQILSTGLFDNNFSSSNKSNAAIISKTQNAIPTFIEKSKSIETPEPIQSSKSIETPESIQSSKSIETPEPIQSSRSIKTPESIQTFKPIETPESIQVSKSIENHESIGNDNSIKTADHFRIPIIMYHHIEDNPSVCNDMVITPQKFKEDMLAIKASGFTTIDFKELINFYYAKGTLPKNPIIITFDDGYKSNYIYAYPILKALNMKATISIIGWSVGRDTYINSDEKITPHFSLAEAKEMYDSGLIDIQNHSYDLHDSGERPGFPRRGVSKLPSETGAEYKIVLKDDFTKLKALIEMEIGNTSTVFTYPYGIYNNISEEILKESGFQVSLTTQSGISDIKDGLFGLKRINAPYYLPSKNLIKKILDLQ